jgi:predicted nucleic acid-binding protein
MSVVVDSSVVVKWILPEADSMTARRLVVNAASGESLLVLDLAIVETANAIWRQYHRHLVTEDEARRLLGRMWQLPVSIQPSIPLIAPALDIAIKYDCAIYDALFIALTAKLQLRGVTADEPLWQRVHADFPGIILLRDWR